MALQLIKGQVSEFRKRKALGELYIASRDGRLLAPGELGLYLFGHRTALTQQAVGADLDLSARVVQGDADRFQKVVELLQGAVLLTELVHADGVVVQVIAVVNHPGRVFALGQQCLVVFEGGQLPERTVKKVSDRLHVVQVEAVDRIGR